MPQLSIIIPIYNTPVSVLERCFSSFDSLQTIRFEVVLVDDGSQPTIGSFCSQYAQKHPCFRYFHKENGGVSSARNFGLDQATGDYIMFVDADDTILPDAIDPALLTCGYDFILFDALVQQGNTESILQAFPAGTKTIDTESLLFRLLTTKALNSPWAKLYARSIMADIRFLTDFITGEDWMFVCSFAEKVKSVHYVDKCCYRYYLDDATAQSRITRQPNKVLDNQLNRFARKETLTNSRTWTRYTKQQILSLAAVELIENLFNTASELLLAKLYSPARKACIRQTVAHAGTYLCNAPKKCRLKLFVLTRFPAVLGIMAILRKLYLKLK